MLNNGVLDSLGGIISTGKEAVIIYAKGGRLERNCCFFMFGIIICKINVG